MYMWLLFFLGIVFDDIVFVIDIYKKGYLYKCDKDGIIDIGVGKVFL